MSIYEEQRALYKKWREDLYCVAVSENDITGYWKVLGIQIFNLQRAQEIAQYVKAAHPFYNVTIERVKQ